MGQVQSYYRILGLEADASASEIRDALQKMRDIDTEGSYTAILNKIEKNLLPRNSRKETAQAISEAVAETAFSEPDPVPPPAPKAAGSRFDRIFSRPSKAEEDKAEAPPEEDDLRFEPPKMKDTFYDLGDEDHDMAHPQARLDRAPVQDTRRFLSEEEIRAYNRPPSTFAKIVNTRNFILLALAGGAIAAGYIFGMPLYQQYLAGKQSNDALPVITRATEEVDRFIRQNKYFPDNLSGSYGSEIYSLRIDSNAETLYLTFNQQAAEPLRGHAITMESYLAPNIGLQWRCGISAGFPETHKPTQCR